MTKEDLENFKNGEELTPEVTNFFDSFQKKEELLPELKRFFEPDGPFPMLRHPLVYSIMHSDHLNALMNRQFVEKTKRRDQYEKEKDWAGYVFIHERAYRLAAFMEIMHKLSDRAYWRLAGEVWTDSENIYQTMDEWNEVLSSDRKQRDFIMSTEDRKFFKKLPEYITIYRGHTDANRDGLSWTLDEDQALWFSSRFQSRPGEVSTKVVMKEHCIGYLNNRGENEIIINPYLQRVINKI